MPKVVDHDLRRAELVAATWQVIAEEGITGATVRRIAEAARCTTGRVTHYFATKNDMLVAALSGVYRAATARMVTHLDGGDPRQVLRAVLLEALPIDEERQVEWKVWLAFWGSAATDARLRLEQERRYASWRSMLDELLGQIGSGRPPPDRQTAVDIIACGIDGLGIQAVLEPSVFTPQRLERAVDALITAATLA